MDTITLSLESIKFDPELARQKKAKTKKSGGLEAIKESIRNVGLKEPLIVYEDNGSYFLCDGYNRITAIQELKDAGELPENLDTNSLNCITVQKDIKNIIRYMTDIRQDLQPSLKARYIRKLFEKGMTRKEIARICGYSQNTIRNWLNVSRLSEVLQDLIDNGKLPVDSAVAISPLNDSGQQHLFNKIKNWKLIRRDEIRSLVATFPNKYFRMSKSERDELGKKLRSKSIKDKQSVSEKRVLSKSLHKLSIERDYLSNELQSFRRKTRRLVAWIERILRADEIRDYIIRKHEDVFKDFNNIVEIELGRRENI